MLEKYLNLSKEVQALMQKMDVESQALVEETGLTCLKGCGECCANSEIEATPLEMLPLALELLKNNQAEAMLDQLKNTERNYCHFYRHEQHNISKGNCAAYSYRPMLCRLFGVSKVGERYSVCRVIKENRKSEFENLLVKKPNVLSMHEWAMKLFALDPHLARERLPINQATKMILEKVIFLGRFISVK